MRTFLRSLFTDVRDVWADPQADPQRTVVFIAAAAIVLLLLFVVLLMVISWGPKRPPAHETRRRRRERVSGILMIPGVLLLLGGVWLAADEFATAPTTCGRCHEIEASIATWKQAGHADTDCMSCHGQSGVMGYVATRVRGLSNLTSHYLRGRPTLEANVIDASCLACHTAVGTGTTEFRSIRVRHQDFLGRGTSCLRCHGGSGHASAEGFVERPTMDKCLACHDNQTASASCDVCHLGDIAEAQDIPDNYPKAHLAEKRTCEGCHSLEPCRKCHKLEMPHPVTFASVEHAPVAAFSGKDTICYRCHEPEECRTCHQPFDAHGPDWQTRHSLQQGPAAANCSSCHADFPTTPICDFCHQP